MLHNPLISLIYSENYEAIKKSINYFNANHCDYNGNRPLFVSIMKENYSEMGKKITQLLLEYIDNIYCECSFISYHESYPSDPSENYQRITTTYFHLVTMTDNRNAINTILKIHENNVSKDRSLYSKKWLYPLNVEYGINNIINKQDNIGITPLHIACFSKNYYQIELFLKNGGDPNILDNIGRSAFDIVKNDKERESVLLFIKNCYHSALRNRFSILEKFLIDDLIEEIISYF